MQTTDASARPVAPYALFIRLEGEPVLVVGGGDVAERKVASLLEAGAVVTVVSPEATATLRAWAEGGRLRWMPRRYEPGDGSDVLYVVCATGDRAVDEAVYDEAMRNHQLVNVVDVPGLCNAFVPSVLQRGRLQVAVSTGGASPSVARDIRRQLEREFPPWWERYLDLMAELRLLVKERVPGSMERRAPLYDAIQASDLKELVAQGQDVEAEWAFEHVVAPLLEGGAR